MIRLSQVSTEELSGGERQRVAIGRALSIYPPILLADEPTGNLDTHTSCEIMGLIRELHQRLEATIVIAAHDPSLAESCPRHDQDSGRQRNRGLA